MFKRGSLELERHSRASTREMVEKRHGRPLENLATWGSTVTKPRSILFIIDESQAHVISIYSTHPQSFARVRAFGFVIPFIWNILSARALGTKYFVVLIFHNGAYVE